MIVRHSTGSIYMCICESKLVFPPVYDLFVYECKYCLGKSSSGCLFEADR